MAVIDAKALTDDALKAYDQMMVQCYIQIEQRSVLAVAVWSDVLKELGHRNLVKLIAGSYDNPGGSNIMRLG